MSWQLAAWIMLGGSMLLLFLGLPVAFTFLIINLLGAVIWLGSRRARGVRRRSRRIRAIAGWPSRRGRSSGCGRALSAPRG